ncbi:NAD-dependent epimerase/dehydratase [Actinosynnema sp. NPDC023587]|uniref:NAD-dependent epimerase/dehydratase family protein n=1 Tax=Actinosynnema sp. NPDC023587 TaxID=3154695 RepID=UPI0033EE92FD
MTRPLVVVLGASGFLGTAIAAELAGHPVRLRLVARRPVVGPAGAEVRRVDLTGPGAVAEAVAGADVVVNLVAHIEGASTWRVDEGDTAAERVNVGVARDLVDALRARRGAPPPVVLFAGSLSQVGRSTGPLSGTEEDRPVTAYDRQKTTVERMLFEAGGAGVLRGIVLRLGTVYGRGSVPPELEHGVVSGMARRALAGQPLTVWGDGLVRRDLVCVEDVARAFAAALGHADALAGRHWLIGTGEPVAVVDLFSMIAEAVAERTGAPAVPVERVESAHAGDSDAVDFVVGTSAFADVTGWRPRVGLRAGLAGAVAALAPVVTA